MVAHYTHREYADMCENCGKHIRENQVRFIVSETREEIGRTSYQVDYVYCSRNCAEEEGRI